MDDEREQGKFGEEFLGVSLLSHLVLHRVGFIVKVPKTDEFALREPRVWECYLELDPV